MILTDEEVNANYEKSILDFLEQFEMHLQKQNKMTGSKCAFAMLMVRDPSVGNVDIASNLTTDSLIPILEFALKNAKEHLNKNKGE